MIDKKNSTNMRINNEKGYKIVADNLGEYSIFRADDTIVSTEIQDKIFAESVLDELNALHEENEQLKQDKKRLIGYLHRYGKVDVEDIDDVILNKEYFDEWGDLYD